MVDFVQCLQQNLNTVQLLAPGTIVTVTEVLNTLFLNKHMVYNHQADVH